jgi:hypothetical protein
MRIALTLPLLLMAGPLAAQELAPPKVFLGGSFIVAEPQQEFADHVNTSFGASINALWRPQSDGPLGIRFEGGFIGYGSEKKTVPFSETVGGRVMVDVTTSNFIAFAHAGPQLSMTRGPIRPYIAPSVGFAYMATVSSVSGSGNGDGENSISDTNYDDVMFSYGATGGVYIPVSRGSVPVAIDLSLRYHRNGRASYLVEGSIQDNDDGTISFDPVRTRANMLTFQVGVSVGIVDKGKRDDHRHRDR